MKNMKSARLTGFFILLALMLTVTCPRASALPGGEHRGRFICEASWYSNTETQGRKCADGRYHRLDTEIVVASWDYSLGSILRIRNLANGQIIYAEVVDRGPARRLYNKGRKIDLSAGAFKALDGGKLDRGILQVMVEVVK